MKNTGRSRRISRILPKISRIKQDIFKKINKITGYKSLKFFWIEELK